MPVFDVEVVERATARTLGVRRVEAATADAAADQVVSPGCLAGRVTRADFEPTASEVAAQAARAAWEFFDRIPPDSKKARHKPVLLLTRWELSMAIFSGVWRGVLGAGLVLLALWILWVLWQIARFGP